MSDLDDLEEGIEYDVQGTVDLGVTVTLRAPFTEEEARNALMQSASYGDGEAYHVEIDGVSKA